MESFGLKSHWRGPFVAILSTPTAVKVAEIAPCIHHSQVKPASIEWECIPYLASSSEMPTPFLSRTLQNLQLPSTALQSLWKLINLVVAEA
jgi:hypothetical protein